MSSTFRQRLARLRGLSFDESPRLSDETRWYTEHTALLISALKWAMLGAAAGFAAVFGTPVSGALFGIEVLYLGRIDYTVIFPALVAGIVAHPVCGVRPPFPSLQTPFADSRQVKTILIMLVCGALFGLIALLLIESLRFFERALRPTLSPEPFIVNICRECALADLTTGTVL